MLTKTIKTTSGPLKISIPSGIHEISLGMLEALTPELGHSFSPLEYLSKLSGVLTGKKEFDGVEADIDTPTLSDIPDLSSLQVFDETIELIAIQLKAFEAVQAIPDSVQLCIGEKYSMSITKRLVKAWSKKDNLKRVQVITNLGIAPAGAYMEAKQVIKKEHEAHKKAQEYYVEQIQPGLKVDSDEWQEVAKAIEFNPSIAAQIRLLSLYLHGPATGERFNTQAIIKFDSVVRKLMIIEALPIARHFFLKYPNLSKPKATPSLESLKTLKSGRV